MTVLMLAALTPNAHAQDTSPEVREAAQLNTSGFRGCSVLSAITPFFPAEASHVYGVRLPVDGDSRFEVDRIVYSLIGEAGIPICNGARSHRLDVWVQDTDTPDATPQLQHSAVITPTPSGAPNDFYSVDVPDFVVSPGQQVFVGFEMTADASDDVLCVLTCTQGVAAPTGGEHFWSNAATTPYAWADIVTGFGLQLTPLVRIEGDRLVIDPTATIGNGVSLGADAVVGADATLRDRASIGNGAVIGFGATVGHDATIGAGARIGADAVVQDRADIGAGAVLETGVSVGHDSTIGSGTSIGARTRLKARAQIGVDVWIGDDVTIGHDVVIEDGAQIGDGTVLKDRAVVRAGAALGDDVVVTIGASVPAGASIADGTTVR